VSLSQSDLYSAFDSAPDSIVDFLVWLAGSRGLEGEVRVADIGAGPGRLLAPLAQRGWAITAYEPNPEFHASAARIAANSRRRIQVKLGGFENIDEESSFDLVIAVNGPFAYLVTPQARSLGLRAAMRALRPGGEIVIDVPNFEWILSHYREPTPEHRSVRGGHVELRREHRIDQHARVFTTIDHYTVTGLTPNTETARQTHRYAMVPPGELVSALEAAGFENVQDFGSFGSRTPQASHGSRLLLVGSKHRAA
jgi:SAM-dependent methyltransferase